MIRFGTDICRNLGLALGKEWLETNGLGGFASSTIVGLNTRRYHGLLMAATKPPVGRLLLLSKLEETLHLDGHSFDLSANQYPGVVHPQGFQFLREFRLDPFPIFTYEVEGVTVAKTVFLPQGENTVVVQYALVDRAGNQQVSLELRPLIAFRDYHSTTHENGSLNPNVAVELGCASFQPYDGVPTLHFAHNAEDLNVQGSWYRNFQFEREKERGLDFAEDLFNPFLLRFDLAAADAHVIASTEKRSAAEAAGYRTAELRRREQVRAQSPVKDEIVELLTLAADQYIVARGDQKTVIAGYHWFCDWGRDTMIALPGLTLPTGRFDVARSILRSFARVTDRGMLPNCFTDGGETPQYNTVDATLWFFEAVRSYIAYTGDYEFVRNEIYNVLADIVAWHVRGTRYNIKVDAAGLLNAGEPGVQLTWMDAKVGDWVVTPRIGKPVEIQALWYNALCIMAELAAKFGDTQGQKRYQAMAALTRWSFNQLFWNEAGGYLYDVVNGGPPDASRRPNQIFAVSLPYTMLSFERARRVVEVVEQNLLTPYGLRSLAPGDPQYRGHYGGGPTERDGAYHQGTVWAWLIGPFISAYLRVSENREAARRQAEEWLQPLQEHLYDAGLGHVSEIFDANAPYKPAGCIAQAWSVAELLRTLSGEVRGFHETELRAAEPLKSTSS